MHPHGPFPPHPELRGTDPTLAIDARVPNPNVPITPDERLAHRYEIAQGVDRLLRMHEQHGGAVHNAGPDGNMRRQFDAERGWAAAMSGGGPRPDLDELEFSRQFRQGRTVRNTGQEVQRAGRNIEDVLADSDITDLVGYSTDMLRVVQDNERQAYRQTTERDRARQTAQTIANNRRTDWEARRAADRAFPHSNPTARATATVRTAQVGHEAIVAHDAARVAQQSHELAAGGEQTRRGFATLYNTIVTPIFDRYRDNMRRAAHLGEHVGLRLNAWQIGTEPDPILGGIDSQTTRLQELRGETIDQLPRRSTGRAEQLHDATIDRYRIAERHVLHPNQSANSYTDEEFTPDGGMHIGRGTPDEKVIFDDGSQALYDPAAGRWVRRWSNGEEWTPQLLPLAVEPPGFYTNREHATDAQLEQYAELTRAEWESVRSPDIERDSLYADRALIERYDMHIGEHRNAVVVIDLGIADRTTSITTLQTRIGQIRAKYDPGGPSAGDPLSPDDLGDINTANTRINALQDEIRDMRTERRTHVAAIPPLREDINRTEYWVARHTVNEGRLFGHTGRPTAEVMPDGAVVNYDVTLNGIHGNWMIEIDGSASLLRANGTIHSQYRPNGTRI